MTVPLSRRRALTSAATLGVGVPLLTACGDDGTTTATDATSQSPRPTASSPASAVSTTTVDGSGTSVPPNEALVATADVPVGGGVILADQEIVVTQPAAGEFKAFSAICTHQSCLVTSVADGTIDCSCHGSRFDVADGSVAGGPAPSPLAAVAVRVVGDEVLRG